MVSEDRAAGSPRTSVSALAVVAVAWNSRCKFFLSVPVGTPAAKKEIHKLEENSVNIRLGTARAKNILDFFIGVS